MSAKILVADDDFDNRAIVTEVLEIAGYQVVTAINGEEALEVAIKERPDVMLLDLSMPKLNGWEVARRLRQRPDLAYTAIIAFTAHALLGEELKAKAAGCDDYLSKPCLPKDVLQKVKAWVERKPKAIAKEIIQ